MQKRLEYLSEHNDLLLDFPYGFTRTRFSMECVESMVADVIAGFVKGKETLALAR